MEMLNHLKVFGHLQIFLHGKFTMLKIVPIQVTIYRRNGTAT